MRASVDPCDPDYHPMASRCRVFLEGAERNNVITADEEKRFALLHRLDDRGRVVVKDGKAATDAFYGTVRIELPDGMDEAAFQRLNHARGGVHPGGARIVGECAPELRNP